ncbi:MAG: YceI family protein [Bacteroidota bacterium]
MKKPIIYSVFSLLLFFTYACKKSPKEPIQEAYYSIENKNIIIDWTAYKTSEKIPVKGTFKEVEINNIFKAKNPVEVIKDVKFSIPVNSIYSKDSIRDFKLRESLFGTMKNTVKINGVISLKSDGKGEATLTLNGLDKTIPVLYEVHGENIKINTRIDLDNWQAQAAITALNVVCSEKHKAADGISKTWSEVDVEINIKTTKIN